jgi:hypothetical protein
MIGPVTRFALLAIAGTILGLPLGYWRAHKSVGEGAQIMSETDALGEYETLASLQYKQSNSEYGKQALIDLLEFMKRMELASKQANQKDIDGDRAFVYLRLALLDEKAGNMESYRNYIQRAQESLRKRSNEAHSEDQLRDWIVKYDSTAHYLLPFTLTWQRTMR